jgi:hypothetical protein
MLVDPVGALQLHIFGSHNSTTNQGWYLRMEDLQFIYPTVSDSTI